MSSLAQRLAGLDSKTVRRDVDCGGPPGYSMLLGALADPMREEHEQLLTWGGIFDPAAFELAEANIALQRVRWP